VRNSSRVLSFKEGSSSVQTSSQSYIFLIFSNVSPIGRERLETPNIIKLKYTEEGWFSRIQQPVAETRAKDQYTMKN